MGDGRLRLTYELRAPSPEEARAIARDLTVEQTVEIPEGCYSEQIEQAVVSRIERLEAVEGDRWRLVVSVAAELVGERGGRRFELQLDAHRNIPAIVAVIHDANAPPSMARGASRARSGLRSGASGEIPPIWMPIEAKFAKPHRA